MTDKQRKFADEYLINCNATLAYKAIYTHVKKDEVARANGSRLLTNANIRAYVDERLSQISSERIADAKEVMEYLTSVLRGEAKSEIVVIEGCGDGRSVAKSIVKTPDEREKLKAAELIGKRYGLYSDKISVEGNVSVVIKEDIGKDD